MPFIAAAAVAALRQFPIVNASFESGAALEKGPRLRADPKRPELAIRYHRTSTRHCRGPRLGADCTGGPTGREKEASLRSRARITDLAPRARTKKLSPDEVGGIDLYADQRGAFGGEYGMPIINQPESAIFAVGGLGKEPAVLTDAEGNESIAIRSVQRFCLGFDHRLIDGARRQIHA